jgi:hypothetical protein
MDITTDKSIPTTDDQELANLLAGLSQDKREVTLPLDGEVADKAGPATTVAADDVTTDDSQETKEATPASEATPTNATADAPEEVAKPAEIDALTNAATEVATPNPMNVIDELNARDTAPPIVGSTNTTKPEPTVDELASAASGGTAPVEPLEFDAATVSAASEEAEKKAAAALNPDGETPSASEELNVMRDKILNYLSDMIRDINQPPEEKFNTILSILQGTEDRSLLKIALETAEQIADTTTKAKALTELVKVIDDLITKK